MIHRDLVAVVSEDVVMADHLECFAIIALGMLATSLAWVASSPFRCWVARKGTFAHMLLPILFESSLPLPAVHPSPSVITFTLDPALWFSLAFLDHNTYTYIVLHIHRLHIYPLLLHRIHSITVRYIYNLLEFYYKFRLFYLGESCSCAKRRT